MTIEREMVPAETPDQEEQNEVLTEVTTDWKEDITIPVPLSEYLKLKKKINKLQNKCKKIAEERDNQRSEKWRISDLLEKKEKSYDALKADYQKLLGINEDDAK